MIELNDRLRAMGATAAVYRMHTDAALGDTGRKTAWAQHYTGRTPDLDERIQEHRTGRGAKMLRAAVERGIDFHVDTVYACTTPAVAEQVELWFKARSHAPQFCRHCRAVKAGEIPPAEPEIVWVERLEDVMSGRPRKPFQAIRDTLIGRWQTRAARRHEDRLFNASELITESEARERGWSIRKIDLNIPAGDYPLDPISEEEWQDILRQRRMPATIPPPPRKRG